MLRNRKLVVRILSGSSDASIRFSELLKLLKALGFEQRVCGDHHIFPRDDVIEIVNLQPRGSLCKPYQTKQVRQLLLQYRLGEEI